MTRDIALAALAALVPAVAGAEAPCRPRAEEMVRQGRRQVRRGHRDAGAATCRGALDACADPYVSRIVADCLRRAGRRDDAVAMLCGVCGDERTDVENRTRACSGVRALGEDPDRRCAPPPATVTLDPPDSRLAVGERVVCTGMPCTVTFATGPACVTATATRDGYEPRTQEVCARRTSAVTLDPLPPPRASVTLEPADARLAIGDHTVCTGTPCTVELSRDAPCVSATATREGYEPQTGDVCVDRQPTFTLVPLPGRLVVAANHPDAELHVDGVRRGRADGHEVELPAGRHQIRVTKRGFERVVRSVELAPGAAELVTLTLTLLPEPPDDTRTWALVAGIGAGVAGIAAGSLGVQAASCYADSQHDRNWQDQFIRDHQGRRVAPTEQQTFDRYGARIVENSDAARRFGTYAAIVGGIAATAAITAFILWLDEDERETP